MKSFIFVCNFTSSICFFNSVQTYEKSNRLQKNDIDIMSIGQEPTEISQV